MSPKFNGRVPYSPLPCALLTLSMMSSGCLALSIQREVMESWRDPPEHINQDFTVGWTEIFETGTELDSVLYQNETTIVFDETVISLSINFRAQFPYSSTLEDLIGNETNQVRYVEAKLWEPGAKESGATHSGRSGRHRTSRRPTTGRSTSSRGHGYWR